MNIASGELEEEASETIAIGNLYLFLSRIFLEPPSQDLLGTLKDVVIPTLEEEAQEGVLSDQMKSTLDKLQSILLPDVNGTQDIIERLATDYTYLLRGYRKKRSPPPPYESVYLEGVMFGNSAVEVGKLYRSFGLDPKGVFMGEPPDHIGLQIAFLGNLTLMEADALKNGETEAVEKIVIEKEEFVFQHLKWIHSLHENVSKKDTMGFYSEIISLTMNWIELNHPGF